MTTQRVLFIDDEPTVLEVLKRMLYTYRKQWELHFCMTVDEALRLIDEFAFDVIVSDARMPVKDGFWFLDAMRNDQKTCSIPVIILTGDHEPTLKRKALEMGAADLLTKPICSEDLVARISSAIRLKKYQDELGENIRDLEERAYEKGKDLEISHHEVVWRLAKACEHRDEHAGRHILRVAAFSKTIAKRMDQPDDFQKTLLMASSLHDIGSIGVPDAILLKPDSLTEEEWRLMRRHTQIGYDILLGDPEALKMLRTASNNIFDPESLARVNPFLKMAADVALNHHEKWDGSGYPQGLSGTEIPLAARITTIADVFDALVSTRPYRPAYAFEDALGIMRDEAEKHFDPDVWAAFDSNIDLIRRIQQGLPDE
jgi:response regulator RpfG family c-di-GMP phosphodiesterase